MNCKQLKKVEKYHDGTLLSQEFDFMKSHLEGCPHCLSYLNELKSQEVVLSKLKTFKPILENPAAFKHDILNQIHHKKESSVFDNINKLIDAIIFHLVQPVTKYSFVSAAAIIFGIFVYQQTIIVQKIGTLEKKMESNVSSGETRSPNRKNIEAFFKNRSGGKSDDNEFNNLLEDYRHLQIQHKVLLKALKNKYPETYQDIIKELEEAELLPENINI